MPLRSLGHYSYTCIPNHGADGSSPRPGFSPREFMWCWLWARRQWDRCFFKQYISSLGIVIPPTLRTCSVIDHWHCTSWQLMLWFHNTLINFICNYRRQLSACSSYLCYLKLPCFYVTELRKLEGLMLRIYHNTLCTLRGTQSVDSNYCMMWHESLHSPGNNTNWQSAEEECITVLRHNYLHNPAP
jgi:hypothetical protein